MKRIVERWRPACATAGRVRRRVGNDAAYARLLDHQIAELAMLTGHMDGLGRVLTILRLESEAPVQIVRGTQTATGIKPELDQHDEIQPTGYFNNRPALLLILKAIGVSPHALTVNELMLNPALAKDVARRIAAGETVDEAPHAGEF